MKVVKRIRSWQAVALAMASQTISGPVLAQSQTLSPPVGPQLTVPSAASLTWQPKLGDERAFTIKYTGTARVDYGLVAGSLAQSLGTASVNTEAGAARLQSLSYDVDAVLHTRVVSVDLSGWVISAQFERMSYLVDGEADARNELFRAPFLMRFDPAGRVRSLSFLNRYPEEFKRAIHRIVEPLQVVLEPRGATAWTADESGVDTGYSASYRLASTDAKSASIIKNKSRIYRTVLTTGDVSLPGRPEARIAKSEAKITFDLGSRNVSRVELIEATSLYAGKALFTEEAFTFTASSTVVPTTALPTTLVAAEAALNDLTFAKARFYDVSRHSLPLVQGLGTTELMTSYQQAVGQNTGLGIRVLESWLRLNPSKSIEVARKIDALDPKTDERAFSFGWAALASAGHREAQEALVLAAQGNGFKAESQEQALIAMMSIELPELSVARAAWALRTSLAAEPLNASGARLSIATNVYGAIGAASKGNPAVSEEVARNLFGLLTSSQPRQQVLALDALSNVGDHPGLKAKVAPSLRSNDPGVRVAAFSTFRRMNEASFADFAAAWSKETSSEVRLAATQTAAAMEDSEARAQWARGALLQEPVLQVQAELVHILGRGLSAHRQNEAALRSLLAISTERAVRRSIYTYISPTPGAQ